MVERNLSSPILDELPKAIVDTRYFVRITFKTDPPGTLRFTNRYQGFVDPWGDVDGTNDIEWLESDFRVDTFSQSQNNILEVSSINFANVDGLWTQYLFAYGLRETAVSVWRGFFDADGLIIDAYQIYEGQIDATEITTRAHLALAPFATPHSVIVPGREYSPSCGYIFKDATTCQYAGGDATCARTVADCTAKGNIVHFGGFPFVPKPNTTLTWGAAKFSPG